MTSYCYTLRHVYANVIRFQSLDKHICLHSLLICQPSKHQIEEIWMQYVTFISWPKLAHQFSVEPQDTFLHLNSLVKRCFGTGPAHRVSNFNKLKVSVGLLLASCVIILNATLHYLKPLTWWDFRGGISYAPRYVKVDSFECLTWSQWQTLVFNKSFSTVLLWCSQWEHWELNQLTSHAIRWRRWETNPTASLLLTRYALHQTGPLGPQFGT